MTLYPTITGSPKATWDNSFWPYLPTLILGTALIQLATKIDQPEYPAEVGTRVLVRRITGMLLLNLAATASVCYLAMEEGLQAGRVSAYGFMCAIGVNVIGGVLFSLTEPTLKKL